MAVSSHGTLLKVGNGATPEVFTTVAEVMDISGPAFAVATEEVTSHDSSGWREYVPTLREAGEVSFELMFNNGATQGFTGGLYNDMINRTKRNFQLVIPTTASKTAAFSAHVTGWEFSFPVEGVIRASLTLQITGSVTWS